MLALDDASECQQNINLPECFYDLADSGVDLVGVRHVDFLEQHEAVWEPVLEITHGVYAGGAVGIEQRDLLDTMFEECSRSFRSQAASASSY